MTMRCTTPRQLEETLVAHLRRAGYQDVTTLKGTRYVTDAGDHCLKVSVHKYATLNVPLEVLQGYERSLRELPGVVRTQIVHKAKGSNPLRDQVIVIHRRMWDEPEREAISESAGYAQALARHVKAALPAETTDRICNAEQIRWQRQAAALLGKLLELAARDGLPPVAWTVQTAGASVTGEVLSHPDALRREHLTVWKSAITAASGRVPDHDNEHTFGSGETRLVTSWEHLPVRLTAGSERYPRSAGVALVASIWPDDDQEAGQ